MARYKDYCDEQSKMIPISFREQILPGTFEYTLSYLIDHEVDLQIMTPTATTMVRRFPQRVFLQARWAAPHARSAMTP
jgi:hypothetical protein